MKTKRQILSEINNYKIIKTNIDKNLDELLHINFSEFSEAEGDEILEEMESLSKIRLITSEKIRILEWVLKS